MNNQPLNGIVAIVKGILVEDKFVNFHQLLQALEQLNIQVPAFLRDNDKLVLNERIDQMLETDSALARKSLEQLD